MYNRTEVGQVSDIQIYDVTAKLGMIYARIIV